jgi:hypothetical protein
MNNSVIAIALLSEKLESLFEALPRGILPHRGSYCKVVS